MGFWVFGLLGFRGSGVRLGVSGFGVAGFEAFGL